MGENRLWYVLKILHYFKNIEMDAQHRDILYIPTIEYGVHRTFKKPNCKFESLVFFFLSSF